MNALSLAADERQPVADAAAAYADALPDSRSAPYRALASAVATARDVPDELIPALERVCVLSLQSGKARELGRAESERLVMEVFRRTPLGRSMLDQVTHLNGVLSVFVGQPLHALRADMPLPGCYILSLQVGAITLRLRTDDNGIAITSIE